MCARRPPAAGTCLAATLPAGTYVVGDPCYSIPDEKWMDWLTNSDFTNVERDHVLVAPVDGQLAVGVHTAFGDGVYRGSDGNEYGVDAGLIGLVPLSVAEKNSVGDDRVVVTFDKPFVCRNDGETIVLGHITIPTGDTDDDERCDNCGSPHDGWSSVCDDCQENHCEGCGTTIDQYESHCDGCNDDNDEDDD